MYIAVGTFVDFIHFVSDRFFFVFLIKYSEPDVCICSERRVNIIIAQARYMIKEEKIRVVCSRRTQRQSYRAEEPSDA